MSYLTRDTLLKKMKNRDSADSWEDFVAIYKPYIYSVIKNLGVNQAEIDDLMQSVFLTCWEKLPEFDYDPEKGKFRYWLSRVTTWACNNHLRKSARRTRIISDSFDYESDELTPEIEEVVDREWKSFITDKAWENVRNNLSGKMLEVYEKILAGADPADISAELDIAENTVAVYRSRVEKKIVAEIQRLKVELE